MSVSKWTTIYWMIEGEGGPYVGSYETDGSNIHGSTPSVSSEYTLISEAQMKAMAINQKARAFEALNLQALNSKEDNK